MPTRDDDLRGLVADLYLRKSIDDRGKSAARQEEECREDCAEEEWTIGRVFSDPDRSASRFARKPRPGYAELVAHIESGQCRVLVLWEWSRSSRRLSEAAQLIDLCRDHKVLIRITSHRATYNMLHRRDWATLAEESVDAHGESERLSERSRSGIRAVARRGKPTGRIPYGYERQYDPNRRGELIGQYPHPDEAPIVREIADRVDKGDDLSSIARDLTARGIPNPGRTGTRWYPSSVRRVAVSPTVAGQRVHRGAVIGSGDWEALITEEQHARILARLGDPDRLKHNRGSALRWPLAGVARCALCRAGRLRTSITGGARRYECNGCGRISIAAEALDAFIERVVLGRLCDAEALAALRAGQHDDSRIVAAQAEVDALQARLADFYARAAEGKLTATGLAAVEARLLPEVAEAQGRLRALHRPDPLAVLDGVPDVRAAWAGMPPGERRALVVALADIEVAPGVRGRPVFDPWRLGASRWSGDPQTWGDHWRSAGGTP